MKLKICLLLLVVALLVSGCTFAKETHRETEIVNAVVTGVDYDPPRMQPMMVGKVMTIRRIPADYDIFVEYEGITKTLDSKELYELYENNIGGTIEMELITIFYDNGETRQRLERSD